MIDYELYRIFVKVAEEKNITSASEKMNISQPAVTKRIKNLESLLNVKLFDRSKTGMKLTDNGEKLYSLVKEPLNSLEKVEIIFNNRNEIRIGTRKLILSKIFTEKTLYNIYKKYNYISINIQYLFSDELFEALLNEKIDLVLYVKTEFAKEDKLIKFIPLGSINDVFVVNKSYFESMNKQFSQEEIKKEKIYVAHPTSMSAKKLQNELNYSDEEKENIKYVINSVLIQMIKNENIIGMIPKEYIQKELDDGIFKVLKTDFQISETEIGVYYNKNNMFKELNDLIKIIMQDFKIQCLSCKRK